ncbi:hypothetical protein NIES37_50170 [Tolypothrix tenuis PCC 7101]|uniref:Uncharacterized protein n=1 Tax=Tolypothrix tenuis PCC 7101 TaxID=231146 RepID=A0A1Z4N5K5_9CYAN|nr:hypothetical protein NIES37_50170 [Tolypothrix tenuis PCC 7101]BAZ75058.1 hypothetical protein NIES50_36380 [Aulosira laxa NIES-50]
MFLKGLLNKKIFYRCVAGGDEGDKEDEEDEGAGEKYHYSLLITHYPFPLPNFFVPLAPSNARNW